jgi:hypothetical protein
LITVDIRPPSPGIRFSFDLWIGRDLD